MRSAACRNYNVILDCQRHFFENAARQDVEEAGTLSRPMMAIANDALLPS
jgi:hypothetical protein